MQAALGTNSPTLDRECLAAWRRHPRAENLRPLIERYLAFVYSSAWRRTESADRAADVTRAVFLTLARRARKMPKKTIVAAWLFHVTEVAVRKVKGRAWWRFERRARRKAVSSETNVWTRVAPEIDDAIDRLRRNHRNAVLLCSFLDHDLPSAARIVRAGENCVVKRLSRGVNKLARRLSTRAAPLEADTLASACAAEGCAVPAPETLLSEIIQSIRESRGKRPAFKLARRTLRSLAWVRWRRRFVKVAVIWHLVLAILGGIAWYIDSLSSHSRSISTFVVWSLRFQAMREAEPARPWPASAATARLDAAAVRNAQDLYYTTHIWLAHLNFTREQWKALEPHYIGPMPNFIRSDGMWLLRNPEARRSGIAGVFGYEFDWSRGNFEFGGVPFTNVGVRVKGNLGSLCTPKRSFRVDLNKLHNGPTLTGRDELTFNNLVWDSSYLKDALGYEFFRDAGVPAPRTAFAWLTATVAKKWERKPLGLYLMLETLDEDFAKEQFGSKRTPLFKPVTYDLFKYLGDDWSAYAAIYDLKTEATPEQLRRVGEFARLVSFAADEEFAANLGDYLDLDEFARFLAVEVLLSNYDSILADGQNFYMYLHPRSHKFGFIPWDLDAAWGFFWLASKNEFERASIWRPWVGQNRFLERLMAVEEFRRIYRGHLEDFVARLFVAERLHRRIDELAAIIRDPIAAESTLRFRKFEQAVGLQPVPPDEPDVAFGRPPHQLKKFIEARAKSVRRQLDGTSKGVILKTPSEK